MCVVRLRPPDTVCLRCVLQCVGPSMLPTFNARGDLLLQEWFSVYTERIRVGESGFDPGLNGLLRPLKLKDPLIAAQVLRSPHHVRAAAWPEQRCALPQEM